MNNGEWGLVGNKRGEHLMANTISTNTNESFHHVSFRHLMTNSSEEGMVLRTSMMRSKC